MFQIQQITSDPYQTQTIILPDGSSLSITMYFQPMQYAWTFNEIRNGDFILNGLRITNNANMLYQFKNVISFGLACFSDGDREPSLLEDFSSGASKLYILTSEEVEQFSELLANG